MEHRKIWHNGLIKQNPSSVQLLGLCPLLAVTNSTVTSLGLSLATIAVLLLSNGVISIFRNAIPNEIRIPIFVLIISSMVTVIILLMQAFFNDLYHSLGIYVSLIVTNCIIIGRAETFATKNNLNHSLSDGLAMGIGISWIIILLGMIRELLSNGTILYGLEQILGSSFERIYLQLFTSENNFILAKLAPGSFICFGFLIALLSWIRTPKAPKIKEIN